MGPPHNLLHSGASDSVERGGPLEGAQRRGRWSAITSVQRYTKLHRLVERRAKLPATILKAGT
eukprot:13984054-Heterocapsa_arctica.AAC.1